MRRHMSQSFGAAAHGSNLLQQHIGAGEGAADPEAAVHGAQHAELAREVVDAVDGDAAVDGGALRVQQL